MEIKQTFPHPEWTEDQRAYEVARITQPFINKLFRETGGKHPALFTYHYDDTGEYITDYLGNRKPVPWDDPEKLSAPARDVRNREIAEYHRRKQMMQSACAGK